MLEEARVESDVTITTKEGKLFAAFQYAFASIGEIAEVIEKKFPDLPKGGCVTVRPCKS